MLSQARDHLRLFLGEKAPTLVPVSQVMMCMNCTSDFSLTLRRHHCHSCGRVSPAYNKNTGLDWYLGLSGGDACLPGTCRCLCLNDMLFDADCLSELLQEQIPAEIHERPHGQSVRSLLQRAEEER